MIYHSFNEPTDTDEEVVGNEKKIREKSHWI